MGKKGFVYVLSNESYSSGLLKIGKTTKTPDERAKDLSTTGVPTPFIVELFTEVDDCSLVESEIHNTLSTYRKSLKKEFFDITIKVFLDCMKESHPKLLWHTGKIEESLPFKLRKVVKDSEELFIKIKIQKSFDLINYKINIEQPLTHIVENIKYRTPDCPYLEEDDILTLSILSDIQEKIKSYNKILNNI